MILRSARLALPFVVAVLLAGCGGGGTETNEPNPNPNPNPGTTILLSPTSATLAPGGTRTFTATVANNSNTAVTWTASGGTVTNAGVYTAPSATGTYTVRATSVGDPSKSAAATVTVRNNVSQALTITPTSATLLAGRTQQFNATATGFSNPAVTWTATGGTVSSTGLYTAPSAPGNYVVRATSVEDPSFGAEARVTVSAPLVVNPSVARIGVNETIQFSASIPDDPSAEVTWSTTSGTITTTGLFRGTNAGSATVTATLVSDTTRTATATVTVQPVGVTVDPTTATVERGATFDFDATVTGATVNTGVTWTASVGTINSAGLFTAPTSGTTATIRATSIANPSVSATATVTLIAPLPNAVVTVSPTGIQVAPGGTFDFSVTVTGTTNTNVTWTTTGGAIDGAGLFTAATAQGDFEVRATSVANPNRSSAVAVRVVDIPVNITPRTATVRSGQALQFSASVGGSGAGQGVVWSATGGTIDANGRYVGVTPGTHTVTAASTVNGNRRNTATVVVTGA